MTTDTERKFARENMVLIQTLVAWNMTAITNERLSALEAVAAYALAHLNAADSWDTMSERDNEKLLRAVLDRLDGTKEKPAASDS